MTSKWTINVQSEINNSSEKIYEEMVWLCSVFYKQANKQINKRLTWAACPKGTEWRQQRGQDVKWAYFQLHTFCEACKLTNGWTFRIFVCHLRNTSLFVCFIIAKSVTLKGLFADSVNNFCSAVNVYPTNNCNPGKLWLVYLQLALANTANRNCRSRWCSPLYNYLFWADSCLQ